jgi:Alkylated DNA repair protein
MQSDLFGTTPPTPTSQQKRIALSEGAEALYIPAWLAPQKAAQLFHVLTEELQWSQPNIRISGNNLPIPRLQSWFGDEGAVMRYSGKAFCPQPWHPALLTIRESIELALATKFNSVLVNLYRDGQDSVGWHADDEKELGTNPVIASLSLGERRRFILKPKQALVCEQPNLSATRITFELGHGDLLAMLGSCQTGWQHAVPKTQKNVGERINLTFRNVRKLTN